MSAVAPAPARHLLRAKDLIDARYAEPLDVPALARAARLSPAHFSREFRREFGETPHQYLLTRRLERAAALLRSTDRSGADLGFTRGLPSVGAVTTSVGRADRGAPTPHPPRRPRRPARAAPRLGAPPRPVADICFTVGLRSVGSFTTSFGRAYGVSPTAYRAAHPPAADRVRIPTCVLLAYARPRSSTFGEDRPPGPL